MMKSLVITALLITLVGFFDCSEITEIEDQNNFSMLSCTEARNITIVMDFWYDINAKILRSFNELIANEHCFFINVYLNSEDRVVRVRKGDDLVNLFERHAYRFDYRKMVKLINRLHEKEIFGDAVGLKQTFVIVSFEEIEKILPSLRKLQDERKWTIITMPYIIYEIIVWLPLHRFIQIFLLDDMTLTDIVIKNLMDVIRNPDFDRYDMAYRRVMARNDFFTPSCLKGINKIHFLMSSLWYVYLPMVMAILRKENNRREQEKQVPLEIIFYYNWGWPTNAHFYLQPGGEYMKIVAGWGSHPLHKKHDFKRNRENVYIHLLDGWLDYNDCRYYYKLLLRNQQYRYQIFRKARKDACYNEESIKTFGSIEELMDHMNYDICGSKK